MALPLKAASDLAKDMAKKGISGSISLAGKPEDIGSSGSADDVSPEKDDGDTDPALVDIAGDISDAVQSSNKADLAKYLQEFCERIAGSEEPDGDEGDQEPSPPQ